MQYLCEKNGGVSKDFNELGEFEDIGIRPFLNSLIS